MIPGSDLASLGHTARFVNKNFCSVRLRSLLPRNSAMMDPPALYLRLADSCLRGA